MNFNDYGIGTVLKKKSIFLNQGKITNNIR